MITLDCLGMPCPRPVIELARHIDDVAPGGVIAVLADDPAAGPDIAAWCRMRGHEFLGSVGDRHQVRRSGPGRPDEPGVAGMSDG